LYSKKQRSNKQQPGIGVLATQPSSPSCASSKLLAFMSGYEIWLFL